MAQGLLRCLPVAVEGQKGSGEQRKHPVAFALPASWGASPHSEKYSFNLVHVSGRRYNVPPLAINARRTSSTVWATLPLACRTPWAEEAMA